MQPSVRPRALRLSAPPPAPMPATRVRSRPSMVAAVSAGATVAPEAPPPTGHNRPGELTELQQLELEQLLRVAGAAGVAANAAARAAEKAKKALEARMTEYGLGVGSAPIRALVVLPDAQQMMEAVIEAEDKEEISVAALREELDEDTFMRVVSATKTAVSELCGTATVARCTRTKRGKPSLKVRKPKD